MQKEKALGLLVVVKPRANLRRLPAGTEPRITGQKQVFPHGGKYFSTAWKIRPLAAGSVLR